MSTTTAEALDVRAVLMAGEQVAACLVAEGEIGFEKADLLDELTASLIGTPNAQTQKPHSASSAVDFARNTTEYRNLQRKALDAERATFLAKVRYEVARITA